MKLPQLLSSRGRHTVVFKLITFASLTALFVTEPVTAQAIQQAAQSGTPLARAELGKGHPAPVTTRSHPQVNKSAPATAPFHDLTFSESPKDAEFFTQSIFEEPLIPIGGQTTTTENKDLVKAVLAFRDRKEIDDFSGLESFLATHPRSAWAISILTNLGLLYRKTGWYSKSLSVWEQAWALGKTETNPGKKAIVDRSLAELIELNARVGRVERLEPLFAEIKGRTVLGSSHEKIEDAEQGLEWMKKHPEAGYRCGPLAVESLRLCSNKPIPPSALIRTEPSSPKGTNLLQVQQLAAKIGLPLVMAKRSPGSTILAPSIVNWKVGHFAAVVKYDDAKGLVQLHDPTFSYDVWVTPKALDAESSGYWLITAQTLPKGWLPVSNTEGSLVWGKGPASLFDPDDNQGGPDCPICDLIKAAEGTCEAAAGAAGAQGSSSGYMGNMGMGYYTMNEASCSLGLSDAPLGYLPKYGPPVKFQIDYSQRESSQPSIFTYSNVSPLWTFNWCTFLADDPANAQVTISQYTSGGGILNYSFNTQSKSPSYGPEPTTQATIKPIFPTGYELDMTDGSKQIFNEPTSSTFPRKIFVTKTIDPTGNALTYSYDSYFRMTAVRDASGLVTTITYGNYLTNSNPLFYLITKVTDPFGRSAILRYDPVTNNLISSTDTSGIVTTYQYSSGSMIGSMTTPYGTTTFSMGQTSTMDRFILVTDPLGGQERTETDLDDIGIPPAANVPPGVDNQYLAYRNNLYWSKKAMASGPPTINTAVITQFRHSPGFTTMSDVVSSVKMPLENRVYYNYTDDANSNPPYIVTGATNLPIAMKSLDINNNLKETDYTYNSLGNRLTTSELYSTGSNPKSRVTTFEYDPNQIDVLKTFQGSDVINQATYYANHQIHTSIDASGQTTTYTYDSNTHQLNSVVNPKGELTTYNYSSGFLTSIVGPQGEAEATYTYDGFDRVQTATDVNGYTINFDYDALNRITAVTYPDSTTTQDVYTYLDVTQIKDRQNRWSTFVFNANRLKVTAIDPDGRYTNYQRCICGELTGLTDPKGNLTKWVYDIEGRLVTKTYPDLTTETTLYEPTSSRVASATDAKGQVTSFSYNVDDTLSQNTYTNCTIPTAAVSFIYDTVYTRITSMIDGTGTTTFSYNPPAAVGNTTMGGDQLAAEVGPLGATAKISYSYDVLGRVTGTSVNGVSSSMGYDSLNRVNTATNPLGTFTYNYLGMTPRVQSITSTNGPQTNYTYETIPANKEIRLAEIQNLTNTGLALSKFDYTYNPEGTIATWQQQTDSNSATIWNYQYDAADQLLSATKTSSTQTVLANYVYQYDQAGNRTSEQIGLGIKSTSFNNLNQITGSSGTGSLQFGGTLSKPSSVTIGGNPAYVDASNNYTGFANVTTGVNNIPIVAKDFSGNTTTKNIQVTVPTGILNGTPSYDILGNMTNNGAGQTYEWDGKNEMTAINYSGAAVMNNITRTECSYDGLMRRTQIVEKNNSGTILSTKQNLWIGNIIAQERDASNAVQKRFYSQGVQISTTNYFYTCDHLGSTRELVDNSGTIQARYDYDPYGRVSLLQGTNLSDFQFCGYYEHQSSGLSLTKYRAYDSNTGRWLSRDPVAESGGINIYKYCGNNPISHSDSSGLDPRYDNTYEPPEDAYAKLDSIAKAKKLAEKAQKQALKGLKEFEEPKCKLPKLIDSIAKSEQGVKNANAANTTAAGEAETAVEGETVTAESLVEAAAAASAEASEVIVTSAEIIVIIVIPKG